MTQFNDWDDSQPIYRQLRDKVIRLIIDGSLQEGEAVPSVRQVASDYQINHLTVSKAYQELVEGKLLEKRRGVGMFVEQGARATLLAREKNQFITVELPLLAERMKNLGFTKAEVIDLMNQCESGDCSIDSDKKNQQEASDE
ncbi:MAG: GntR family transcriptional regulator [Cellvibrionaceae bacterium]